MPEETEFVHYVPVRDFPFRDVRHGLVQLDGRRDFFLDLLLENAELVSDVDLLLLTSLLSLFIQGSTVHRGKDPMLRVMCHCEELVQVVMG